MGDMHDPFAMPAEPPPRGGGAPGFYEDRRGGDVDRYGEPGGGGGWAGYDAAGDRGRGGGYPGGEAAIGRGYGADRYGGGGGGAGSGGGGYGSGGDGYCDDGYSGGGGHYAAGQSGGGRGYGLDSAYGEPSSAGYHADRGVGGGGSSAPYEDPAAAGWYPDWGAGGAPAPPDDDVLSARRVPPAPRHDYTRQGGGWRDVRDARDRDSMDWSRGGGGGGPRGGGASSRGGCSSHYGHPYAEDEGPYGAADSGRGSWRGGGGGWRGGEGYEDGRSGGGQKRPYPHWDRERAGVQHRRPRPRRPQEEELDLWCKCCMRGLQDRNSMAAHLKSKKHRQALEVARKEEEEREEMEASARFHGGGDEDGGGGAGEDEGYYMEKNQVSKEEKVKMLREGGSAIERAPKAFKAWANRSLLAAKAKSDERVIQAVFREIVEELLVHQKNGTISYQNWPRRDDATGDMFKNEEPIDIRIPLFNAPRRDPMMHPVHERAGGSTRGLGAASGSGGGGGGIGGGDGGSSRGAAAAAPSSLRTWFNPAARRDDNDGAAPAGAEEVDIDDTLAARHKGGKNGSRPVPATMPDSMALTGDHPRTGVVVVNAAETVNSFLPELPGYRAKPAPADPAAVPLRRRNSRYRPRGSHAARNMVAACAAGAGNEGQLRRTALFFDRDFAKTGGPVGPSGVGTAVTERRESVDVDDAQEMPKLRERLRELAAEDFGKHHTSFAPKVAELVDQLEGASKEFTTTLMEAYELLVDVYVLQEQFPDAVEPCKRLMTVYRGLSKCRARCRNVDKFRAYFIMLLLFEQRKPSAQEVKKLGKFRDPRNLLPSPAAHLAHFLQPWPYIGRENPKDCIMTKHALSVLNLVLNRDYINFFRLYRDSVGIEASNGMLRILMDGATDVVRSDALMTMYSTTDMPAVLPLNDIMMSLNWYNRAENSLCVDEACDFMNEVGAKVIEAKNEDGVLPATGSAHVAMKCYDPSEQPPRRLKGVYGVVNRAILGTAGSSLRLRPRGYEVL